MNPILCALLNPFASIGRSVLIVTCPDEHSEIAHHFGALSFLRDPSLCFAAREQESGELVAVFFDAYRRETPPETTKEKPSEPVHDTGLTESTIPFESLSGSSASIKQTFAATLAEHEKKPVPPSSDFPWLRVSMTRPSTTLPSGIDKEPSVSIRRRLLIVYPPAERPELHRHFNALASRNGCQLVFSATDRDTCESVLVIFEATTSEAA